MSGVTAQAASVTSAVAREATAVGKAGTSLATRAVVGGTGVAVSAAIQVTERAGGCPGCMRCLVDILFICMLMVWCRSGSAKWKGAAARRRFYVRVKEWR